MSDYTVSRDESGNEVVTWDFPAATCGDFPECHAEPPTCGHLECIDPHAECDGPVEYRAPLSGSGRSFPRCEKHWEDRLDRQEEINRRYPDSPFAPADFDPTYAGETWNEEE